MNNWANKNPREAAWFMEYHIRKELGGYFPKNFEKAFFFMELFSGFKKMEKRKNDLAKTFNLARRGGN